MNLRSYRQSRDLTLAQAAAELGMDGKNPARTLQRIELGEVRWDAEIVERIVAWSNGSVTLEDLHRARLKYLLHIKAEKAALEAAE